MSESAFEFISVQYTSAHLPGPAVQKLSDATTWYSTEFDTRTEPWQRAQIQWSVYHRSQERAMQPLACCPRSNLSGRT